VFGRHDLDATCAYAAALLAAAIDGTPLPPTVLDRWQPFHALLGPGTDAPPIAG
jgi:hypothetical protein